VSQGDRRLHRAKRRRLPQLSSTVFRRAARPLTDQGRQTSGPDLPVAGRRGVAKTVLYLSGSDVFDRDLKSDLIADLVFRAVERHQGGTQCTNNVLLEIHTSAHVVRAAGTVRRSGWIRGAPQIRSCGNLRQVDCGNLLRL